MKYTLTIINSLLFLIEIKSKGLKYKAVKPLVYFNGIRNKKMHKPDMIAVVVTLFVFSALASSVAQSALVQALL